MGGRGRAQRAPGLHTEGSGGSLRSTPGTHDFAVLLQRRPSFDTHDANILKSVDVWLPACRTVAARVCKPTAGPRQFRCLRTVARTERPTAGDFRVSGKERLFMRLARA